MPHALRSPEFGDEITAEPTVLVGFDQDFAAEATRTSNRIRGIAPASPSPSPGSPRVPQHMATPHTPPTRIYGCPPHGGALPHRPTVADLDHRARP
ncbi:hypothetical protein GCM10018966_073640 [Streptomyces yanii]